MIDLPTLMTTEEAAKRLGVHPEPIRRAVRNRKLAHYRFAGVIRIAQDHIADYLAAICARYQVSNRWARGLVKRHAVPVLRLGRRWLFDVQAETAFLEAARLRPSSTAATAPARRVLDHKHDLRRLTSRRQWH